MNINDIFSVCAISEYIILCEISRISSSIILGIVNYASHVILFVQENYFFDEI